MSTVTQTKPMPGQSIPLPASFSVDWQQPADAKLMWNFDPMHFPHQIKPLTIPVLLTTIEQGFNCAAKQYDMPIRQRAMVANTYVYTTILPIGLPPEAVLKVMKGMSRIAPGLVKNIESKAIADIEKKYLDKFEPVIARLGEYWETELLPEVKAFIAHCQAFDLAGASMPALFDHLNTTLQQIARMGEIHFAVAFPMLLSISRFDELYHDLFPGAGKFDGLRLLQGLRNRSIDAGNELWKLSRRALTLPTVKHALETLPAEDVHYALSLHSEGRVFLAAIETFLQEFGQRGDAFDTLGTVSWIEDPSPVMKNLQDYITQPDRDIEGEQQALAAAAERAIADIRAKLKSYPQAVRTQFDRALQSAQAGNVLQEDHNYWLDQRSMWQMRAIFLEFGRRFAAAGVIDKALDVFYLELDELKESAQQLVPLKRQSLVATRKADYAHFAAIQPPVAIGTLPAGAPPNDTIGRTMTSFFGFDAPEATTEGNELHGLAGSPGKVRGIAKVVHSLADASKLKGGDILVAETTAPPWTPLFATAAGIVTATGGILSHCAIVAREYNLPAVVGVRNATTRLEDGMLIEVDGDAGTVTVVE